MEGRWWTSLFRHPAVVSLQVVLTSWLGYRPKIFNIFSLSFLNNSCNILTLYLTRLAAAAAKLLQSCPTLCDPIDGSPPGSHVPGILQARILEWVAISFSNAWKWKVKVKSLHRVWLLATPWLQPTRLLRPWDFPGKSTGVGCHCLLQQGQLARRKANLTCASNNSD